MSSSSQATLTTGARIPVLSGTVTRAEGLAFGIDEEDFAEVRLRVRPRDAAPEEDYAIDEEVDEWTLSGDGTSLSWNYEWQEGDTEEAGTYYAQIRITLSDGREAYAPTDPKGLRVRLVSPV